nr:cupin domain-containing protein [Brevibacillus agri]
MFVALYNLFELDPGASYLSMPHNDGVYEYISVSAGRFALKIKEETFRLGEGDAIRFTGNVPHAYSNDGEQPL